ncbi:cytochrome P450 [Boeremia exigua]|uniref:cytochrome P450 n=1 Tax=Boeremia exigua TaxID=749465 RepID=UPI001E8D4EB3|nr:cytochrome P450 [Boeremia exigua]KAH6638752.1 cytochrome P450 [Boeremia exigua]
MDTSDRSHHWDDERWLYLYQKASKNKLPIFTLPMLTGRTYIVTDPALCAAVQKASTAMSFDPIVAEITPRLVGSNDQTTKLIRGPPGQAMDKNNIVKKSHHVINPPLLPQNIHGASKIQLDYFGGVLAKIKDGAEMDLFRFARQSVTAASMTTFFGPNNPFEKHPELIESFWDWEAGNVAYMTGIFPSIFARDAARGLEACIKGFEEYVDNEGYENAYKVIRERSQLHVREGIADTRELAKLEVAISLGFNVNAATTTFWIVDQVFSRPGLLSKIREEIHANALLGPGILSADSLRQACPRLNSAYRETMRLYVPSASARLVVEDTMVADTWLLRKGAIVQLAGTVIHHNPDIWGLDVEQFNPDRFLYSASGSKTNPDGTVPDDKAHFIHPAAFRSFGGGASLCPGRHFAQMEVLALAATLIMGFEMAPINGTTWNPPADIKRLPIAAMKPLAPLDVKVRVRKEFEGVQWQIRP